MTLSSGPWWCAPVFALGWMTTVPAQSFSAPARAWVMAAARFMPGVWAGLMSSSSAVTTRTPSNFHLRFAASLIGSPILLQRHLERLVRIGIEAQTLGQGDDGRLNRPACDVDPIAQGGHDRLVPRQEHRGQLPPGVARRIVGL